MAPARLMKSWGLALLAGAAVLAAGCADRRGGPLPYDVALPAPDRVAPLPLEANYRIAPLDMLAIKVFRMPDLSGDYEVDLTGQVSLPLVGAVPAAELTTAELDDRLTSLFGAKYLESPDISVGVKSSTRRSITVDGAVRTAGSFPVGAPVTLMQAVAMAGGAAEDANTRRIAVFRTVAGKRQAAAFDLAGIRRGEQPDPAIYAGDIVIIDGSRVKAAQKQLLSSIPLLSIFRPF